MRHFLTFVPALVLALAVSDCTKAAVWTDTAYASMLHANIDGLKARADKGDAEAAALLGEAYMYMTQDVQTKTKCTRQQCLETAMVWFRKAADGGNAHGAWGVASLYGAGMGVPRDPVQAVTWYQKAAQGGDAMAQMTLGVDYREGNGVAKDLDKAEYWLLKSAKQGYPEGEFFLSAVYSNQTTPAGFVQCQYWLQKAAEDGQVRAQFNLAERLRIGADLQRDMAKSRSWYERAAAQGDLDSKAQLGWFYFDGESDGVEQNDATARTWWEAAGPESRQDAALGMGHLYEDGRGGVTQDYVKAAHFYTVAANLGSPGGMTRLAMLMYDGRGVTRDVAQSHELLDLVAHQEYPAAEGQLAWYYHRGDAVAKDDLTAYAWAVRASHWGNADGRRLLAVLDRTLSSEDKTRAWAMVDDLIPDSGVEFKR